MLRSLTAPAASWSSALIAALIGFGGTVALIVQAVQAMGGSPTQTSSAVTALCLGIAVAGAALSFAFRMPIVLAWSTPGAALIGASTLQVGWPAAVGAFLAAAAMMVVLGLVPALGRLAARIPPAVASAMLAGVLLPFCLALFRTFEADAVLAGTLLVVFVAARQRVPLYALLLVLAAAVGLMFVRGDVATLPTSTLIGTLAPTMPEFSAQAIVSLGMPLFLVTLVSQNLPGLVVLRTAGYEPAPQPLLLSTGLATLLLAPFGAHGVNLAAITAAICTSADAHPDRGQRWVVGILYAGFYLGLALFSAPLVALFLAMPPATIAAITGIALIGPLTGALEGMMAAKQDREAAILTFAATASGVALWGIGSAFWGLVIGFIAIGARAWLSPRDTGMKSNPGR